MATSKGEEIVQFIFSFYRCTSEVKLNIEEQMAFLTKKINLDMTDEIITFMALY